MKILNIEDLKIDLKNCWIWQYDNAPNLLNIMKNKEEFFKFFTETILKSFINNIFNLNTANNFGLGIWRRILGAKKVSTGLKCENLALEDTGEEGEYNFVLANNKGDFRYIYASNKQFRVDIGTNVGDIIDLFIKDALYRRYLVSKLMLYYMRGTLPEIQRYLEWLFPNAGVKVTSSNNMTYNVNYNGTLNNMEKALLELDKEIFPKIYGVEAVQEYDYQRWAFWDGDYEEKYNKVFVEGEDEESKKENYPYTYVGNGEDEEAPSGEELKGHGTNL